MSPPAGLTPDDPRLGRRPAVPPPDMRPSLAVVVDTEEEFDWDAPFSRENTGVTAMRHVGRVQAIFDRFGVVPTYVVDYPVATQAQGRELLVQYARDGRALIGAHLHPWVTPPFDEVVGGPNSFACNLPPALERAKLTTLRDAIRGCMGVDPRVYKAGRYGFGASTVDILQDLEFDVDASVNPHWDFTGVGGPSFEAFDARPFLFGDRRTLLELPCSGGFVGHAAAFGTPLFRWASHPAAAPLHVVGVLVRLGLLNRVMLSPEGFTLAELKQLASALVRRGCRTLSLTFHSPSVEPGHTPYVRSNADLEQFLATIESFLEFFFHELEGVGTTPLALRAALRHGITTARPPLE
jgi:hypothetical protein